MLFLTWRTTNSVKAKIVRRIRWKNIGTVLCWVVYNSNVLCAMIRTRIRAVLKDECWFRFRFSRVWLFRFSILHVFWFSFWLFLPHAVNCGRFCFWRRQSLFLVMVALWNRADHYIFMLWFVLLFLFFPRLISAAADWMSSILPHMVWP